MYNAVKMKELLVKRDSLDPNYDPMLEEVWEDIKSLLQTSEDLDKFSEFLRNEITHEEFETIEEIIDELNVDIATQKFIDALEETVEKYPKMGLDKFGFTEDEIKKHESKRPVRYMLLNFKESLAEREANK